MTDYTAAARTNYFRCKDIAALNGALSDLGLADSIIVSTRGPEGMIMLYSETEFGDWPTTANVTDSESGEDDDLLDEEGAYFDIVDFLAGHLAIDEVAVVMEVGFTGISDLVGWAQAVNAQGEQVKVSLDDILDRAAEALGKRPRPVFV